MQSSVWRSPANPGRTQFRSEWTPIAFRDKDVEYRQKPKTSARIETSFASLLVFFGTTPVSAINDTDVARYKTHRIQINRVRDVTLRHDLHALSLFFQYAEKMAGAKAIQCGR